MILSFLWRHRFVVVIVCFVGYLALARAFSDKADKGAVAIKQTAFEATAKELGLVKAELITQKAANEQLNAELAKKGGRVAGTVTGAVHVKATESGTLILRSPDCPKEWTDTEDRFHVNLQTGEMKRHQEFLVAGTAIEGPDGKSVFGMGSFKEISPKTGLEIPSEDVKVDLKINVVKTTLDVSPWHRRLVAAAGSPGFGAGVQFWNYRDRANLSALGLYGKGDKSLTAGVQAGYRVRVPWIDSTVSAGPFAGYRVTPKPAWTGGLTATIELSR